MLIDPHGSLSDQVISKMEEDDLIYVSPRAVEFSGKPVSVGFNAIAFGGEDELEADTVAGWIRDLFANEASFSQGTWGPRIELIFRSLLKELMMRRKDANLSDLLNLLIDNGEMRKFLKESTNREFRSFIEMQMKDWRNWIQYSTSTINKLLPVLSNSSIRNLISSRNDSFDLFSSLKDGNKTVVLEVSKGMVSEEMTRMISTLFLLKLWSKLLSGMRYRKDSFNTYVVVDEAQNIPTSILQKMLSEGRKYGLRLILSNQYLEQMDKSYVKSVFGNVRNFISFNVSRDDSIALSSTIPDQEIAKRLISTIAKQKIHRSIIWNHTERGLSGPLSFDQEVEKEEPDYDKIEASKIKSIESYGRDLSEDPVQDESGPQSLHEDLLSSFTEYLERKGIRHDREAKVGSTIPDANFYYEGTQVMLEVEVSDLFRKMRILRKIRDYSGRKIVFLTGPGFSEKLFRIIAEGNEHRIREGLIMEFPAVEGKEKIYMKDLGKYLENIYIIEKKETGFCIYDGNKCTRFSLNDLGRDSTFIRAFRNLSFPELRIHIYSRMSAGGVYGMKIGDLDFLSLFNPEIVEKFRNEFDRKDEDIITIADLLA